MTKLVEINKLQELVAGFASEREWDQFHTPKNLCMALTIEAAELMEIFQWLKEEESLNLDSDKKEKVCDELADIMVYLVRLADVLKVDLNTAIGNKMEKNAKKYPVEKSRGNAKKYTEF